MPQAITPKLHLTFLGPLDDMCVDALLVTEAQHAEHESLHALVSVESKRDQAGPTLE